VIARHLRQLGKRFAQHGFRRIALVICEAGSPERSKSIGQNLCLTTKSFPVRIKRLDTQLFRQNKLPALDVHIGQCRGRLRTGHIRR
jgi:hypothetical protein